MTVAPGTAAFAAAVTLDAVVPVSSVSPGPWATVAGSTLPFAARAVAVFEFPDDDAAPAICDPARIPPASRPAPNRPAAPIQRLGVRTRPDAVPFVSISVLLPQRPVRRVEGHGGGRACEPIPTRLWIREERTVSGNYAFLVSQKMVSISAMESSSCWPWAGSTERLASPAAFVAFQNRSWSCGYCSRWLGLK